MSDYEPVTGESTRTRHHGVPSPYTSNITTLCGRGGALNQAATNRRFAHRRTVPRIEDLPLCKRCEKKAGEQ